METKRIVTIQDLSCVGQCSLTVALPVLSAIGVEAAVLPTSILSNHTMFSSFTKLDMDEEVDKILSTWQSLGFKFDLLYTGYIGNSFLVNKINSVKNTIAGGRVIVDPAMADGGKLYVGFDDEYVSSIDKLCLGAEVILPNISEACLLTDTPYGEMDIDKSTALAKKLFEKYNSSVVLKGVTQGGKLGVLVLNKKDGSVKIYLHEKISKSFHGTGDIYASVFVGMMENGFDLFKASKVAADFVVKCIKSTVGDKNHPYGVHFEPNLKVLAKYVKKT